MVRDGLKDLLKTFNIIHICGKGNIEEGLNNKSGYAQFEYVKDELPHLMAAADLVISRAGANSIFELLALKKPSLLIPLTAKASRGDQILNAESFDRQGFSMVADEEQLNSNILIDKVNELYKDKDKYIGYMAKSQTKDSINKIITLIEENRKPREM